MAPIRPARLAAWRGTTIGVHRLAGSDCAFQRFLFAPAGEETTSGTEAPGRRLKNSIAR